MTRHAKRDDEDQAAEVRGVVRDRRRRVACPTGRSTPGTYGHSGAANDSGSPAQKHADLMRIPTFYTGGHQPDLCTHLCTRRGGTG